MRKIFTLFALCLLLSGCVDVTLPGEASPGEQSPDTVTESPDARTEMPSPPMQTPSPEDTPAFSDVSPSTPWVIPSAAPSADSADADLIREAVSALIDIDWPENIPPEPAERTIFPLTNTSGVYRTSLDGPVTFVDAELNPVALPFQPDAYAAFDSAYALQLPGLGSDQNYGWVLMLGDGTVPTDENGRYYELSNVGENGPAFHFAGNAVVTYQTVEAYELGETIYFGLYDMKERREILPREYYSINMAGYLQDYGATLFFAEKNGQHSLLDPSGIVLYNLNGTYYDYDLDAKNRVFYRRPDDYAFFLDRWDEYILVFIDDMLHITDTDGQVLFSSEYERYSEVLHDELYFLREGEWYALDKHFNERSASEPQEDTEPVRIDEFGHSVLVAPNGEVVAETDGYIVLLGDFALLFERVDIMRTDPKTVYTHDGTMLLDNVYGWIDEVLAPGGGLFVYLDPETCVLLMPDGSTTPVPNPPTVEKAYHGG